jgi:mRNA interferase YafQ
MRHSHTTKRFRRHYAKSLRSGKDIEKLKAVMRMIVHDEPIPAKYRDHALHGEWQGVRDCHIEGDWILLYEVGRDENGQELVVFHATDTHENLFG